MKKLNYSLAFITLIGFLFIRFKFNGDTLQQLDKQVSNLLFGNKIITAFHYIGDTYTVITVAIILMVILWLKERNYRGMLFVLLTFGGGQVLNQLLKNWVQRPRPEIADQLTSFSYPSGHTMSGMLFLFTVAYFLTENMGSKRNIVLTWLGASLLIFFIGISRIAEGRHYATDVLGGWMIAYTFFILCVYWYERRKRIFKEVQNGHLTK